MVMEAQMVWMVRAQSLGALQRLLTSAAVSDLAGPTLTLSEYVDGTAMLKLWSRPYVTPAEFAALGHALSTSPGIMGVSMENAASGAMLTRSAILTRARAA